MSKHSRAMSGGAAAARSPKLRYPLRKVVDEVLVEVVPGHKAKRYVLECGHLIGQAHDMIGDTYPARRRCRKCFDGEPITGQPPDTHESKTDQ